MLTVGEAGRDSRCFRVLCNQIARGDWRRRTLVTSWLGIGGARLLRDEGRRNYLDEEQERAQNKVVLLPEEELSSVAFIRALQVSEWS